MSKTLGSLPAGALIKDPGTTYNDAVIIWRKEGAGHSEDPADSVILASRDIITLKPFDGKEPNNSDDNRKKNGNNSYPHSNILQWLNSEAEAGAWYEEKHSMDAAPTKDNCSPTNNEYDTEAGFLTNISSDLKAALLTVNKTTIKNTVTDGGGSETVSSKIFLESVTEVGLNIRDQNDIAEGEIYEYYSQNNTNENRGRKPTVEAVSRSTYKETAIEASRSWHYWFRTPDANRSDCVIANLAGATYNSTIACLCFVGVAPAFALPSSVLVSDNTDSDGCYTFEWKEALTINCITSLGDKTGAFDATFSITAEEGTIVSATIELDGTTVQTIKSVVLGDTYTLQVDRATFRGLSEGSHSFLITAMDSEGNTETKTITFNKIASTSTITVSGSEENIGNCWIQPNVTYQVSDSAGNSVNITEMIDGTVTRTITDVELDTDITFDLSGFASLENEQAHILTVAAENASGAGDEMTWTFTKLPRELIYYTEPIKTDAAAKRINVVLNYSRQGNPTVKIEAANNAMAEEVTWEDITEAWTAGKPYEFRNIPVAGFGIAIRVTITKNADTERVFVTSHGFAFA